MKLKPFLIFGIFFGSWAWHLGVFGQNLPHLHILSEEKAAGFLRKAYAACRNDITSLTMRFRLYKSRPENEYEEGKIVLFQGNHERNLEILFDHHDIGEKYVVKCENQMAHGHKWARTAPAAANQEIIGGAVVTFREIMLLFAPPLDQCAYAGAARIAGRPVQQFLIKSNFNLGEQEIFNAKLSIDDKFLAPLQLDLLNEFHKPLRRISVASFKNFEDIWAPKTIVFFDYASRKRSKLEIFDVKLDSY